MASSEKIAPTWAARAFSAAMATRAAAVSWLGARTAVATRAAVAASEVMATGEAAVSWLGG